MKKKILLFLAFIALVSCAVLMGNGSVEAKTYKRKIIDNWEVKAVNCIYGDDVKIKGGKGFSFRTDSPEIFDVDKKGHVTIKQVGTGRVYVKDNYGREFDCVIRVNPPVFEAEDLTIKVGESASPKLNLGDVPLSDKFYYNMNTHFGVTCLEFHSDDNHKSYTITGLEPGSVEMSISYLKCRTTFNVTVVE